MKLKHVILREPAIVAETATLTSSRQHFPPT